MSYAIVRNEKLTRAEINGKGTHNDRKAKNHTNKDIDPTRTHLNYYIKKNELTYTKEFDKYLKENNLQCHLRSNSIIMCQMVFTSDQAFFDKIGEKETKRYFEQIETKRLTNITQTIIINTNKFNTSNLIRYSMPFGRKIQTLKTCTKRQ